MIVILFFAAMLFAAGFLIGWGMKSDIRTGAPVRSDADKIINEMRLQRANDYFNNPVVNEIRKNRNDLF